MFAFFLFEHHFYCKISGLHLQLSIDVGAVKDLYVALQTSKLMSSHFLISSAPEIAVGMEEIMRQKSNMKKIR